MHMSLPYIANFIYMKKILLFFFVLISINTFSKNRVTINIHNKEINVAMDMIREQTGMEFSYNPQVINTKRLISANMVNQEINSALTLLFNDIYVYTIKGRYIIITAEKKSIEPDEKELALNKNEESLNADGGSSKDNCISSIKERKIVLDKVESGQPLTISNYKNNSIMLKKIASIIALSTITAGQLTADNIPEVKLEVPKLYNTNLQKSVGQLSFIFPIGTDGNNSKEKEYKLSLNILGGISGGVNGAEFGGWFNITKQNVIGFQGAGIFNYVQGGVEGVQMAGVMNYSNLKSTVQLAGILNMTQETSNFQAAGIMNYSKGAAKLQIASIANYSSEAGTQISIVNIAKKKKFQLGFVNISDTEDGASLGLFNYVKKGGLFEIGFSTNDYIYGATNLITGKDKLYSILSVGVHSSSLSFGVGVGSRIQLKSERNGINFELLHNNIFKNDFKDMDVNASLEQLRIFYSHRANKVTFYGGPTVNGLFQDVDFTGASEPLYSILENKGSKHNCYLWVGAELGIRINLK